MIELTRLSIVGSMSNISSEKRTWVIHRKPKNVQPFYSLLQFVEIWFQLGENVNLQVHSSQMCCDVVQFNLIHGAVLWIAWTHTSPQLYSMMLEHEPY